MKRWVFATNIKCKYEFVVKILLTNNLYNFFRFPILIKIMTIYKNITLNTESYRDIYSGKTYVWCLFENVLTI